MVAAYVRGFPQDGASLGSTKAQIRDNLDGTFDTLSIDHFNQNQANTGFHKQSTYPNLGASPTTANGQLALYSKAVTGGSALFMVRDNNAGTETQLTSPAIIVPVAATNGYTFMAGGLIYQWGLATIVASSTTPLLFATNNIAFPTNCFNVSITGIRSNSGGDGVFVLSASVSKTGFTFRNGSGSITQAYWTAIGN